MIDWHAIAPELALTVAVVAVLVADLVLPDRKKWLLPVISAAGLLCAAVPLVSLGVVGGDRLVFADSYAVDRFSLVLKGLFVAAGYITLFLSINTIEEGSYYRGEFYFLLLCSVLGMLVISSARDMIVLIVAFELFSAPGYLLAAWKKGDLKSNESGFKYFVLGALSTAIMLYGMAMLYGVTSTTKFAGIATSLPNELAGKSGPLVVLGVVLVIVGFAFKVSAVPFHFWAPDTYEGAPTPVTAFFSVAVKAAGFVGLILLCFVAFESVAQVWQPLLWALSALTMTIGNLIALRQTNIVRMLAYSSIAQSGYILAAFSVIGATDRTNAVALQAAVIYLLVYAVMNLGAFGVVISVARRTRSGELDSYDGLFRTMPVHATIMTLFLGSLTGIPPLAGWLGKFQVFTALASANTRASWVLAILVVLNSLIAAFYYMGVVRRMFFEQAPGELLARESAPAPLAVALGVLAVLVLVAGFTPLLTYFSSVAKLA